MAKSFSSSESESERISWAGSQRPEVAVVDEEMRGPADRVDRVPPNRGFDDDVDEDALAGGGGGGGGGGAGGGGLWASDEISGI